MSSLEDQILAAASTSDTTQTNTPWTVDLGSDKLTFNTPEELSANLRQALAQVNQEVSRIRQEKDALQSQIQTQGQYVQSDADVTNTKFNMDHFINQMKADPVKAFDYVDSIRYGDENPSKFIKDNLKELQAMKQEAEVQKFLQAHPEFPGGQAAHILNQTREELNQPMTKVGLESAYNHAIQNNRIPDFRLQAALNLQQQQFLNYLQANNIQLPQQTQQVQQNNVPQTQYQQPQFQTQNPYPVMGPQGIPTVARNQSPQLSMEAERAAEGMSLEQLGKLLGVGR